MTMSTTPAFPAATVLVVRAGAPAGPLTGEIEVLLVRRSHRASFMANAYVFPGGRVDAADAAAPPEPASPVAPPLSPTHPADPAMAARRAAARELAEEVGLGVSDLAQLVRFAHWITPSAEPKRFDTEFFLWALDVPSARVANRSPGASSPEAARPEPGPGGRPEVKVDGHEVFDPLWLTPAAALERYAAGSLNLPPPTVCTLEDLAAEIAAARAASSAAEPPAGAGNDALLQLLLTRCAARRPLPALPKFFADGDGGLSIVMPWDAQYPDLPGEGAPQPALAQGAAPVPYRIRRCQLKLSRLGTSYAVTSSADPASPTAPAAPAAQSDVLWTVERVDR